MLITKFKGTCIQYMCRIKRIQNDKPLKLESILIQSSSTVNVPGGTPLYKPYRYVPPRRIYIFFSRFGLKTGLHFAHFGLESGIVFDGTTGVNERTCYFSSKMNTEEGRVRYKFEVDRVTIWRTRRHTPKGAHTTCVCYRLLFYSKCIMDLLFA